MDIDALLLYKSIFAMLYDG